MCVCVCVLGYIRESLSVYGRSVVIEKRGLKNPFWFFFPMLKSQGKL